MKKQHAETCNSVVLTLYCVCCNYVLEGTQLRPGGQDLSVVY